MAAPSYKARIHLAPEALQKDPNLKARAMAEAYQVNKDTFDTDAPADIHDAILQLIHESLRI
jgi:hypothetical protein